nr:hypothetical protein [Tanacetum cinerariifolium]
HVTTVYGYLKLKFFRGMYHKKNVDFAYLSWEEFVYQVKHKGAKKSNEMYYPWFTKVIINFFMTKDPSILRRNKYGAILPAELTNEAIRNSDAYKEYYVIASGAEPPKTKAIYGYLKLKFFRGMYHKKNVDFAYLSWEEFVYQVKHKGAKKSNEMYYPWFTKVIINFFMTKDPSILRRNKYGAILPAELTNEAIRNSDAYKEYYVIASGAEPPKTKASVRKTQSS